MRVGAVGVDERAVGMRLDLGARLELRQAERLQGLWLRGMQAVKQQAQGR